MVDLKMLNCAVDASGLKNKHIAECLGITEQCLSRKMKGLNEFKASEMISLVDVLHLSQAQAYSIFFASAVE